MCFILYYLDWMGEKIPITHVVGDRVISGNLPDHDLLCLRSCPKRGILMRCRKKSAGSCSRDW